MNSYEKDERVLRESNRRAEKAWQETYGTDRPKPVATSKTGK